MNIQDRLVVLSAGDGCVVRGQFTDVNERFASASDAIGFALQHSGSVQLGEGDFLVDKTIRIEKMASITGGGNTTRLRVTAPVGFSFHRANGCSLSSLMLVSEGADTGVECSASGSCKIADVTCVGFASYGIRLHNYSFLCTVSGCTLADNKKAGIYLSTLSRGEFGDFIPNLITGCTVFGGGHGIEVKHAIVVNIVGCVVYQNYGAAYYIHSNSNSVLLSGCRSFQVTGKAVVVERAHEINITGNIFCWHTEDGIELRECCWGTVTGNNVIDTGSYNTGELNTTAQVWDFQQYPRYTAIKLLNSRGLVVSANALFNWGVAPPMEYGVYEDASSGANSIQGNNTNYYHAGDVCSEGIGSATGGNVRFRDEAYLAVGEALQTFAPAFTEDYIQRLAYGKPNERPGGGQPTDPDAVVQQSGLEQYAGSIGLPLRKPRQ